MASRKVRAKGHGGEWYVVSSTSQALVLERGGTRIVVSPDQVEESPRSREEVAADVLQCALAHEPGAMLVGNVRADELADLAAGVLERKRGLALRIAAAKEVVTRLAEGDTNDVTWSGLLGVLGDCEERIAEFESSLTERLGSSDVGGRSAYCGCPHCDCPKQ